MNAFAPASGVHLLLLDNEAVVFHDVAQTLHALNTTAAFIWCNLELGASSAETAQALSTEANIPPSDAARHVADCLDQWRALSLLRGAPPVRPPARPVVSGDFSASSVPPFRPAARTIDRVYSLLSSCIRIRYSTPSHEEWVHPVIAHLEAARAVPDMTLDIVAEQDMHYLYRDAAPVSGCAALDQLAPMVKSWMWMSAVNRHTYFLDIHAGVISDGTSVTLLPGAAGNGKSSLTAALSRSGFDCFSDEVALLEEPELAVRPMRLALCVKSTGWDLLMPYFPELRTVKTHRRGDDKIVRYVPPPEFTRGTRLDRAYPVRRIIFPRYVPGSATRLTPIVRSEALRRMLEDCLAMPGPLTLLRVERLVSWIQNIECAELISSSLVEAVALVRGAHGLSS